MHKGLNYCLIFCSLGASLVIWGMLVLVVCIKKQWVPLFLLSLGLSVLMTLKTGASSTGMGPWRGS